MGWGFRHKPQGSWNPKDRGEHKKYLSCHHLEIVMVILQVVPFTIPSHPFSIQPWAPQQHPTEEYLSCQTSLFCCSPQLSTVDKSEKNPFFWGNIMSHISIWGFFFRQFPFNKNTKFPNHFHMKHYYKPCFPKATLLVSRLFFQTKFSWWNRFLMWNGF